MTATERELIEEELQHLFQTRAQAEQAHLRLDKGTDEHYRSMQRLCWLDGRILDLRRELEQD